MKLQQFVSFGIITAVIATGAFIRGAMRADQPHNSIQSERSTLISQKPDITRTSIDGFSQIRISQDWKSAYNANPASKFGITVQHQKKLLNVEVASFPEMPGFTPAKVAEMSVKSIQKKWQNVKAERTSVKSINGYQAAQYKVQGNYQGTINMTMFTTVIKAPQRYHFILAGGPSENVAQNEAELQQVIQSFKEVKKTASTK